jgi:hypothetical protein
MNRWRRLLSYAWPVKAQDCREAVAWLRRGYRIRSTQEIDACLLEAYRRAKELLRRVRTTREEIVLLNEMRVIAKHLGLEEFEEVRRGLRELYRIRCRKRCYSPERCALIYVLCGGAKKELRLIARRDNPWSEIALYLLHGFMPTECRLRKLIESLYPGGGPKQC